MRILMQGFVFNYRLPRIRCFRSHKLNLNLAQADAFGLVVLCADAVVFGFRI